MTDPALEAAHRRAIRRAGQPVTFRHVPPGGSPVDVAVVAVVRSVMADSSAVSREGFSASKPGAITQADRQILVMKADLAAQGFPLPVAKGDRILIAETSEWLQVEQVDNAKRYIAGCVEMTARGVG